jgi:hypothetical protein
MLPELMPSGTREAIEKKRNEESVFGMEAPSLSNDREMKRATLPGVSHME